jgi:predicted dehydrogenase
MTVRFAILGIDHRHVYGMAGHLIDAGAQCAGWWTEGSPGTLEGFVKRFPDLPRAARWQELVEDPSVDLVVIATVPRARATLAIAAMEAGRDVMVDKPGCVTLEELARLRRVQAETGRIWSVDFSERFEVPSATRATELVEEGAIGRVVQTVGLGPHRLNRATRPGWFFDRAAYGGILTDIASHQIDQFLHYTGSTSAEITHAAVENYAHPGDPGLQDFGEIALRSDRGRGYVRVDWFTPDALPNWGDGRLTILGTEGYIELRKYVDVGGRPGTDSLILVNGDRCEVIDAGDAGLPYFGRFLADVQARTETAMAQDHAFSVMELALTAQAMAEAGT